MTTTELADLNAKAAIWRDAYNEHVSHPDGHWKGRAIARISPDDADLVAEAMDFHGSIVDRRTVMSDGTVVLMSEGYWAHGF